MKKKDIPAYLENEQTKVILMSSLLFCVIPLVGILFLTILILNTTVHYKRITYVLFLLLALYMGLINSTKIPYGDQLMYYEAYRMVPHRTLWENLTGIYGIGRDYTTKEMGFGLLNVVGYFVSFGSYALFITLFTTTVYMFLFVGIYKWFHHLRVQRPIYYVISGIFILAFFTQYFNLTIHLQRQVIASAVAVYAIILTVTRKKIPWILVAVSITLHTSASLFLPLFLLFQFSNKLTMKQIFLILGILAVGISAISIFAKSLLEIFGRDIYVLKRIEEMNEAGREERMAMNLVIIISLPLVLIALHNIKKYNNRRQNSALFFFLAYLFLILFSTLNPNNTAQYRYFMMSYAFLPFILPLLSRRLVYYERIILIATPLFLILRFYGTFEDIVFDYAPVETILTSNIFIIFNYNHIS